jgi:hypothetical protein
MLLLLIVYNILILTFVNVEPTRFVAHELGVFGVLVLIEEVALGLFKVELSLFRRIPMFTTTFNLFTWWAKHEQRFPNISHLAQ